MPRYKPFDYKQTVMLPLSLENQLLPDTLEFALHHLIESRVDLSKFEAKLKNDDICPTGKLLMRYAREHKIGNIIFRRYGADEGDCAKCSLREKCLKTQEVLQSLVILLGGYEEDLKRTSNPQVGGSNPSEGTNN